MKSPWMNRTLLLAASLGLAACSGGGSNSESSPQQPLNTDYSTLRLATSTDGGLQYAKKAEQVLGPLRNGIRMSLAGSAQLDTINGPSAFDDAGFGRYSGTTVQVAGVDEADLVKYDGEHIYAIIPKSVPTADPMPSAATVRNVLKIARTDPATAGIQVDSEFTLEGDRSALPLLYQVQSAEGDTEYLATVSQNYQGWLQSAFLLDALVTQPDRTTLQLLDVRDPFNVSQAWKIELDGWLRGSRKIGNTLYLVSSYRPRLTGLVTPADTTASKQANERRILDATAADLLPGYSVNDAPKSPLVTPGDCVFPTDLSPQDAYSDLVVITAVDLAERRVTDVNCVSTNVNGIYVSANNLYVGGNGSDVQDEPVTVLHKFALTNGNISYRATGSVAGSLGWLNASYFMDEHDGDLRIVTSRGEAHSLSVLRETTNQRLSLLATLPNEQRPAPIGKPGELVHAVRFFDKRAYVVTARVIDPLYAIDLSNPADPYIAGALEIPGVSTYLQPIGPAGSELLLAIGRELDAQGVRQGVKVELFDVSNIGQPRSVDARVFGQVGSSTEASDDPHALTLLPLEQSGSYRIALPINVFNVIPGSGYTWSYSGVHLLQVDGIGTGTPRLSLAGVIKTDEPSNSNYYPRYPVPNRTVLHDESVFVVSGDTLKSSLWDQLQLP